jgi:hypothetical protein
MFTDSLWVIACILVPILWGISTYVKFTQILSAPGPGALFATRKRLALRYQYLLGGKGVYNRAHLR